jgi:hypothetical protein
VIRKDYKWPSTGRRRREARVKKFSELLLFGCCVNLITVALVELIPGGNWLYLIAFTAGVVGMTAMTAKFFRE